MECPGRCSAFRIQAPDSTPRKRTGFSKRSIPRNRRAWASGWRSAARSSRLMAAGCGLSQARDLGRPFCSACPMRAMPHHDMTELEPIVFVVDDDLSVRRSTERLLRAAGLKVQTFTSAREFLKHPRPEGPACLVLDVRMPGLSGIELQRELTQSGIQIPIIFITAHGDIPMTVRAMKAGAVEFLTKPFRSRGLLDAVRAAIEQDRTAHKERAETGE